MTFAMAISLFFGLVAALALSVVYASLTRAWTQYRAIRAELIAMDRPKAAVPLRQPQAALARALAV